MKLVFLGPPGAGKGTQASKIADRFAVTHASTGDIFRQAVAGGSELGKTVKSYLDEGKLVSDELTAQVVDSMVIDREDSFILDGFPRTIVQAELLDEMLDKRQMSLDGVVFFQLSDQEAVERLTGRLVCQGCGQNYHVKFMPPPEEGVCGKCGGDLIVRSDSSMEIVEKRLNEYKEKTEPLVDYYRKQNGLLKIVDAALSPDQVTRDTVKVIEEIMG